MPGPFTITAAQLLANDTGTGLKIIAVTQPPQGGGTAVLDTDAQTITYTVPPKLSSGLYPSTDSFGYTIRNFQGTTANATVRINLTNCPIIEGILAVDDAITVESVQSNAVAIYRSSLKLSPYAYMDDLGFTLGSSISMCGSVVSQSVGRFDGLTDFANKVNTVLGPQGFRMYMTDDDGVETQSFTQKDGYVAISRGAPYFSQSDSASLPAQIWGTPTFSVADNTQYQNFVYQAATFTSNDQINGTTKITAIGQAQYLTVTLNTTAQTITIKQPSKVGDGNVYGNIYKDAFTYTISDANGNTSTATINVTIDNGVAVG